MDIRIVAIESQPPIWRVYLNSYFIVCHSAAEAQETAQRAVASLRQPLRPLRRCDASDEPGADRAPFSAR